MGGPPAEVASGYGRLTNVRPHDLIGSLSAYHDRGALLHAIRRPGGRLKARSPYLSSRTQTLRKLIGGLGSPCACSMMGASVYG